MSEQVRRKLKAAMQDNASLRAEVERLRIAGGESEPRFVLLSDYQHLKAEVERLRASSFVTAVPVEQYERVVKAGDAMAFIMAYEKDEEFDGFVEAWNAAKEGKPSE